MPDTEAPGSEKQATAGHGSAGFACIVSEGHCEERRRDCKLIARRWNAIEMGNFSAIPQLGSVALLRNESSGSNKKGAFHDKRAI